MKADQLNFGTATGGRAVFRRGGAARKSPQARTGSTTKLDVSSGSFPDESMNEIKLGDVEAVRSPGLFDFDTACGRQYQSLGPHMIRVFQFFMAS